MTKKPEESKRGRTAIPTDKYIEKSEKKIGNWELLLKKMKTVKEQMGTSI